VIRSVQTKSNQITVGAETILKGVNKRYNPDCKGRRHWGLGRRSG